MSNLEERLESVMYHAPGKDALAAHERLRAFARVIVTFIDENVPAGREQSIAYTKLEEMMMWSHKAVAVHIREK